METVFDVVDGYSNNACVNFSSDSELLYASSYREAADFLAQNAANVNKQDLFVCPIAFMYQHHLELQLKMIIRKGSLLLNRELPNLTHHYLDRLWRDAKDVIKVIYHHDGNLEPAEFTHIDNTIVEYKKLDPESTAFRYDRNKKSASSLEGLTHINLINLMNSRNKISDFLDGIYSEINELLEANIEAMLDQLE